MKKGPSPDARDERNIPFTLYLKVRFENELTSPLDTRKKLEVGGIMFRCDDGRTYKVDMTRISGTFQKDDARIMELELSDPDYEVYEGETSYIPKSALLQMDTIINADIGIWIEKKLPPEENTTRYSVDYERAQAIESALVDVNGSIHRLPAEGIAHTAFELNDLDPREHEVNMEDYSCMYYNKTLVRALEANKIPATVHNLSVLADKAGWIKTKDDASYFKTAIAEILKTGQFEKVQNAAPPARVHKKTRL